MRNRITETATLNFGKARPVSFFETRGMIRAGRVDGKKGLPKPGDEGQWSSSFLRKEIHACQEYCNKLWGILQINLEETYAEIDRIIDSIYMNNAEIYAIESELSDQEKGWNMEERKNGEETLAESVIISRRKREFERATSGRRQRLEELGKENEGFLVKLRKLRGVVVEATTTTKLLTHKMEEHARQRIDVYWDSAYEHHPDRDQMPPGAEFDLKSEGEMTFMMKHANTDSEMLSILSERYSEERNKEKA